MSKIYANQPFKIELTYDELPATAVSQKICCTKPSGEFKSFVASIDLVNKKIYYYSTAGETLGAVGVWRIWAQITDADGNLFPGEPNTFAIYNEGT